MVRLWPEPGFPRAFKTALALEKGQTKTKGAERHRIRSKKKITVRGGAVCFKPLGDRQERDPGLPNELPAEGFRLNRA